MSIDCLAGLLGIKGECGTATSPISGLHVQDLPFITIKNADAGISEEVISGFKLIEDKISFAAKIMSAEAAAFVAPNIRKASVVENNVLGFYDDNKSIDAGAAGKQGGIQITMDQYPYYEIYIGSIWLWLNAAVTTNIYVYDLISGSVLDTISITTVAGKPTEKIVNKTYQNHRQRMNLIFIYDTSVADSYETAVTKGVLRSGCRDCGGGSSAGLQYIIAKGITIDAADTKIDSNVDSDSFTSGMSLSYSIRCGSDAFICSMAGHLSMPLLYKTGAEILRELQYSRRLNSIVTVHGKDIKELTDYYENEYRKYMNLFFSNLHLPDDPCFYCQPKIRYNVSIP